MRRSRVAVATALASLLALSVAAGSAAAHGPCDDVNFDGTVTAREYAQFHISSHTPHGVGLNAHNPGTHMGFSLCLGVH